MTPLRLSLAIAIGLAGTDAAAAASPEAGADPARTRFIVQLQEPALANFTDASQLAPGAPKLAPTSPLLRGGRGLDLESRASRDYLDHLDRQRQRLLDRASSALKRPLQAAGSYRLVVNAVALDLDADEAAQLARLPGVRHVEPEWVHRPLTDAGPGWINAGLIWNSGMFPMGTTRGEGVVIGVVDTGVRPSHLSFSATAGGYVHTNPHGRLFGLCSGAASACNTKLIGIWDMSCQAAQPAPNFLCMTPSGDADDQETNDGVDLDGHGTHVASTAAGNPLTVNFSAGTRTLSGVAPRANLISYKACEGESSCKGSWLLNALEQAAADGVDVLNYSIGGGAINPWYSSAAVAMRGLRAAGTVVVVAAGNDGPGAGTVTSPGNAPWVLTAAASTHDRYMASRITFSGPAPLPGGGALSGAHFGGASSFTAELPLAMANPAQCAQGSDFGPGGNNLPSGWLPSTYTGSLLACEGGAYAIGDQSDNVAAAGGSGVLLLNDEAAGISAPLLSGDIPSVVLSWPNAQLLRSWLASGSGHRARIAAPTFADGFAVADVLAEFSGRGPTYPDAVSGTLKPDVSAPGVWILGASQDSNTGLVFLSGTSMATPHVAGAAALLRAVRPNWRADEIISALSTTALPVVRLQQGDGSTPADPFGQGSGRVDLARAVDAGLFFAETDSAWTNANPDLGGDPSQLNRPSLVDPACVAGCSFQRRVTGLRAANWSVQPLLPEGMTVSVQPSSFALDVNQTRSLQIDVTLPQDASNAWLHGRIRLVADNAAIPAVTLPLSVFADSGSLPATITIEADGEKGWHGLELDDFGDLPEPVFIATEMVPPVLAEHTLPQDPTNANPYDNLAQVAVEWVQFQAGGGPGLIEVYAESATAPDIDLFVGRDDNGDGIPQASEERCSSTTPEAVEACYLDEPSTNPDARYWILVQNWTGSSAAGGDGISIEAAAIRLSPATPSLQAAGPGHVPARTAFPLRLFWDQPGQLPGESRVGYLIGSRTPDELGSIGATRVKIQRSAAGAGSAHVLTPGASRSLRLAPGTAHEAIAIEVPANASSLRVDATGMAGVDLYLAPAPSAGFPQLGAAPPRAAAVASQTGASASKSVTVSGAQLQPGRWFVTPVNSGSEPAELSLSASLTYQGDGPALPFGAYYNPQRSGSGIYLYGVQAANLWGIAWYTYLEDGSPVWYLGAAPAPAGNAGSWTVPLDRYSWNGDRTRSLRIGEATLTWRGGTNLQFSWNLSGESGSEPMQSIPQQACASQGGSPVRASGLWYSPTRSGFGYSVLSSQPTESFAAYLYDGLGLPRWLLAAGGPFAGASASFTALQFQGTCPLCAYAGASPAAVGTLTRSYSGGAITSIGVEAGFLAPASGAWSESHPTVPIADLIDCP